MEKQCNIYKNEQEEAKFSNNYNNQSKQFSNEMKKMNEIILNFQPSEKPNPISDNLTANMNDLMKKKISRNNSSNFNIGNEINININSNMNSTMNSNLNYKKQKKGIDSEKNFDSHFYFEMDSQNKFADDLNVNLLKYNLTHTNNGNNNHNSNINNISTMNNTNNNNHNESINNFIGINYTSNNDENIINSYNNFDLHFNTNSFNQNNFSHLNHIEKSFESDIIKKIVLERINKILSSNNLKEKMMLYMIMCKSDKVCRVENETENEMEKLLEIIKANFSHGHHNNKVQTDVVKKIVLGFCKYLQDYNYLIVKSNDDGEGNKEAAMKLGKGRYSNEMMMDVSESGKKFKENGLYNNNCVYNNSIKKKSKSRSKNAWLCSHIYRTHYARGKCQTCYLKFYNKEKGKKAKSSNEDNDSKEHLNQNKGSNSSMENIKNENYSEFFGMNEN